MPIIGTPKQRQRVLDAVYRLRYAVFVEMKKWEIPSADHELRQDRDDWDAKAIHFFVRVGTFLFTYLRILKGNLKDTMIGNEFRCLLESSQCSWNPETDLEITRLLCRPGIPKVVGQLSSLLLFRSLYRWAMPLGISRWWFVSDEWLIKSLRRAGYIVRVNSQGYMPGDETLYYVSFVDLEETKKGFTLFQRLFFGRGERKR